MKSGFILIMIFLAPVAANAQQYSKQDFVKTDWFTSNLDSLFFTSDTVRLIKHMNKRAEWASYEYAECEMKYLEHGDYLNFEFKKSGEFEYWETSNNCINSVPITQFSWKFDKAHGTVMVYREKDFSLN
jgi:hypothetical protein